MIARESQLNTDAASESHAIGQGSSLGGSLLEPADLAAADQAGGARHAGTGKASLRGAGERWDRRLDRAIKRRVSTGVSWWWRRRAVRWSSLAIALVGGVIGAWLLLRPTPIPDYAVDPMDEVLEFTLLEDDFNKLPVDERLALLKDLIERFKGMGSEDSVLMAQFAAMIEGDLREKMMKNASKLVLDVWDKYALDYAKVPVNEREAYLDETFLNMAKMMETLAGVENKQTDEERLRDVREQAKRDGDMFKSGRGPDATAMAAMTGFLRNGMGQYAPPQQQQRGQQLMRDMTRHFRGKDVETGK